MLLHDLVGRFPRLRQLFADNGYSRPQAMTSSFASPLLAAFFIFMAIAGTPSAHLRSSCQTRVSAWRPDPSAGFLSLEENGRLSLVENMAGHQIDDGFIGIDRGPVRAGQNKTQGFCYARDDQPSTAGRLRVQAPEGQRRE